MTTYRKSTDKPILGSSTMTNTAYLKPNTLNDVLYLAEVSKGEIDHVYLHWTAGHYHQAWDDYHICIDNDGKIYLMTDYFGELKYHTWHRNSNSIGITILGCYDAIPNHGYDTDFGTNPPTREQIETMSQICALLSIEWGLDLSSANDIMTHCEAAELDDYGPSTTCERWDLWYLKDFDSNNPNDLVLGGDLIRGKAQFYKNEWESNYTLYTNDLKGQ